MEEHVLRSIPPRPPPPRPQVPALKLLAAPPSWSSPPRLHAQEVLLAIQKRDPDQPEFLQAVLEVRPPPSGLPGRPPRRPPRRLQRPHVPPARLLRYFPSPLHWYLPKPQPAGPHPRPLGFGLAPQPFIPVLCSPP